MRYVHKDLTPSSRCARRLRLERTLVSVPMNPSWRVLEVGCGAGFGATYLQGRYREYVGLDHSLELVRLAREYNGGPGIEFVAASIADFATDRRFDLIFLIGVLHHLEEMDEALVTLAGLLAPGGYLAVNEPQPANPIVSATRWLRTVMDRSYSSDQVQLGRRRLRHTFSQAGLVGVEVRPQGLFSTPFAEMPLRPSFLTTPAARLACWIDKAAEPVMGSLLLPLSWNLVVVGRDPHESGGTDASRSGPTSP